MLGNNKENILDRGVDFSLISLFSSKLRVGIIGGGGGAFIKAKHFFVKDCYVEILTKSTCKDFEELKGKNLKIIYDEYNKKFLVDKHLIIIAIDDKNVITKIKEDCESLFKIFIDSTSFMEGMGAIPVQKDLENIVVGINTRGGNPKGSVLIGEKIEEELNKYDKYIGFTTLIRNRVKNNTKIKKSVMNFIYTEDFLYFYNKGKGHEILTMFFGNEVI